MKNIYILDEYQSSSRNGIGTFLRELLKCFEGYNVFLIEFNSNEKQFSIKTVNGIKEMHFPPFVRNGFLANYKIIDKFFRLHIEDSPDNWFMLNHSPCENLLKAIKIAFPLSKITFTIHDLGWTSRFSYTGLIGKEELNRWYQVADIGVIPSLSEQCSYTGIEMMMHGLPVVASDGFGVHSMFQDGVNA